MHFLCIQSHKNLLSISSFLSERLFKGYLEKQINLKKFVFRFSIYYVLHNVAVIFRLMFELNLPTEYRFKSLKNAKKNSLQKRLKYTII